MLMLHIQDVVLHLKRKLMGVATGTTTSTGESLHAALLIAIDDLVPVLREMPNSWHDSLTVSPAGRHATNGSLSSMTDNPFLPSTFSPRKGRKWRV
jgi:hypothetical protein